MSESTATKSNVFKEDLALATGGTGAAETGVRRTSTGGEIDLTKIDASHIKFRAVDGSPDDLVDGGNDIDAGVNDFTVSGNLTLSNETASGYLKNTAAGVVSGGNSIAAGDLPSAINAALIADGSVSNAEFQYLSGVTSDIQTQINAAVSAASQAEQETATETAKYVAPGTQKYHPSAAKAWVRCTGAGTPTYVAGAAYNVTDFTDSGTGAFVVNLTVGFSSGEKYAMAGIAEYKAGNYTGIIMLNNGAAPAAGTCGVLTADIGSGNPADMDRWAIVFFGDQ